MIVIVYTSSCPVVGHLCVSIDDGTTITALIALSYVQFHATHRVEDAHEDGIWSVAWTAEDKILSGSVDERARVWYVSKFYTDDASLFYYPHAFHSASRIAV